MIWTHNVESFDSLISIQHGLDCGTFRRPARFFRDSFHIDPLEVIQGFTNGMVFVAVIWTIVLATAMFAQ